MDQEGLRQLDDRKLAEYLWRRLRCEPPIDPPLATRFGDEEPEEFLIAAARGKEGSPFRTRLVKAVRDNLRRMDDNKQASGTPAWSDPVADQQLASLAFLVSAIGARELLYDRDSVIQSWTHPWQSDPPPDFTSGQFNLLRAVAMLQEGAHFAKLWESLWAGGPRSFRGLVFFGWVRAYPDDALGRLGELVDMEEEIDLPATLWSVIGPRGPGLKRLAKYCRRLPAHKRHKVRIALETAGAEERQLRDFDRIVKRVNTPIRLFAIPALIAVAMGIWYVAASVSARKTEVALRKAEESLERERKLRQEGQQETQQALKKAEESLKREKELRQANERLAAEVRDLRENSLRLDLVSVAPGLPTLPEEPRLPQDLVSVAPGLPMLPEEPRVRINAGGHTGVVQGLAFSGDSARLCSAGDKVVHVWNLSVLTRDLATVFLRERTIRWQVARGPLGQIYALASDPQEGLLALAGQAAMPPWGQILLVDPKSGKLMHVLEGHEATVVSLAFSPDGEFLASADLAGQILLWKRGEWKPLVVSKPDENQYGKDVVKAIEDRTGRYRSRFVAFAGSQWLIVPVYARQTARGDLVWKLQQVSVADPRQRFDLAPGGVIQEHIGMVTALAGSRSTVRIVSADLAPKDNVCLWDWPAGGLRVRRLDPGAVVVSLAMSDDGRTLAVGTERTKAAGGAELQLWDAETLQLKGRRKPADTVAACAISPDGRQIAYGGGMEGEVYCGPLDENQPPRALRGHGRRVWKVAFAAKDPPYRIAYGTQVRDGGPNDHGELSESFDPETSAVRRGVANPADWLPPNHGAGAWTAERLSDGTLQLSRDGKPGGRVAFDFGSNPEEGRAQTWCFVPDPQGNPFAIAVATTGQHSIYVFRLTDQPDQACPVLRHFRGHDDAVSSVGVSQKSQYLVSGSVDGTIRFWSLADLAEGPTPYGTWGADFLIAGEKEVPLQLRDLVRKDFAKPGELCAARVHPAGPLFGKGVREGDVLAEILWFERGRETASRETKAEAIRSRLQNFLWGTQVYFRFSRQGSLQPTVALRPAWQPLATLFVGDDGEYAFWTPEGYYDASINGRSLFGWQVNPRSIRVLPEFYRADQFKSLEKPEVMRILLNSGNLTRALREAEVQPKVAVNETIPHQIAQTPRVEILDPPPDALVPGGAVKVRARVWVPVGANLAGVNAYASGVIATKRVKREPGPKTPEGYQEIYEYEVPLPTEERTLIQVVAGTEDTVGPGEVVVRQPKKLQPTVLPKLFILALGVDTYRHGWITALSVSVADAEAVTGVLRLRSKGLYEVQRAIVLKNEEVTLKNWHNAIEEIRSQLADKAQPDDLLLVFLAGHGIRDPKSGRYYFVGHDLTQDDYRKGVFSDCISWNDFRILADIPCRKVAILDTCHSGAIQPPTTTLKTAVRGLQDAMIFTITAANADQVSAEVTGKHGLFTNCLLEALEGKADDPQVGGAGDQIVSLIEAVNYVRKAVPRAFQKIPEKFRPRGQDSQEPVAAPMELIPFTRQIPLTQAR